MRFSNSFPASSRHYYALLTIVMLFSLSLACDGASSGRLPSAVATDSHDIVNIRSLEELRPHFATSDPEKLRLVILTTNFIHDPRVTAILKSIWAGEINQDFPTDRVASRDPRVRLAVAAVSLDRGASKNVDGESYTNYISEKIKSNDPIIRGYAANALGSVANNSAVDQLVLLITSDSQIVALDAISALQKIAIQKGSAQKYARTAILDLTKSEDIKDKFVKQQLDEAIVEINRKN